MKHAMPDYRRDTTDEARPAGVPHVRHSPIPAEVAGAASGAACGAALGAFAGPPGLIAGALIGAAAGAATGKVLMETQEDADAHDAMLDEVIGVTSGHLGAASPDAPPAVRGTYSAGSAGAASAETIDWTEDDGPIPHSD
jgi:hypothetical protein